MGTSHVPAAAPVVTRCLPPEQRRGHPEAVTAPGSPTRSAQSWDPPPGPHRGVTTPPGPRSSETPAGPAGLSSFQRSLARQSEV